VRRPRWWWSTGAGCHHIADRWFNAGGGGDAPKLGFRVGRGRWSVRSRSARGGVGLAVGGGAVGGGGGHRLSHGWPTGEVRVAEL
jgi:hypothetical protein